LLGSDIKIDAAAKEAGKVVATRHHCGSCHLPNNAGRNHIPRPDIDGTVASAAQPMSEKEIVDMAGYLASLE